MRWLFDEKCDESMIFCLVELILFHCGARSTGFDFVDLCIAMGITMETKMGRMKVIADLHHCTTTPKQHDEHCMIGVCMCTMILQECMI